MLNKKTGLESNREHIVPRIHAGVSNSRHLGHLAKTLTPLYFVSVDQSIAEIMTSLLMALSKQMCPISVSGARAHSVD